MPRKKLMPLQAIVITESEDLTPRMRLFIDYYLVCLNGTESARAAGYSGDDAALASTASQLLRNPKVAREIDSRLAHHAMGANETLAHITDIARSDIADVMNGVGATDIEEAKRRGKSHLVKKYKIKVTRIVENAGTENEVEKEIIETEVEMYSRMEALQTLAKYHNLTNTNRLIVDDWKRELIGLLRDGRVAPVDLVGEFEPDVIKELLISAGIRSNAGGEIEEFD